MEELQGNDKKYCGLLFCMNMQKWFSSDLLQLHVGTWYTTRQMIMATVLKMFRWLSISFGQGCSLQKPVLIFQSASSLLSRMADHVNPLKPREMSPESGLWSPALRVEDSRNKTMGLVRERPRSDPGPFMCPSRSFKLVEPLSPYL